MVFIFDPFDILSLATDPEWSELDLGFPPARVGVWENP
jgi:hypothetical protein